jgi:hypothetical protein
MLLHGTILANIFISSIAYVLYLTSCQPISDILKTLKSGTMKTKTFAPVGSLHPVLFFAVVYVVALVLSIFICSSLFYSCNASGSTVSTQDKKPADQSAQPAAVAMR